MKNTWVITIRELRSFFDSLMAYFLLVIFLGLSGFFTWISAANIFYTEQASLAVFFEVAYWTLFFFIPAVTMRVLAEEIQSGTIEVLATKAVSELEIISGKFLACWLLVVFALICTLPYYLTVSLLGPVDHGAVIGGYIGLLLLSGSLVAIGVFASSLTSNQIIAFLIALTIAVFFQIIFSTLAAQTDGRIANTLYYLSFRFHFDSIARGVIDSRNLIYFGSLIAIALYAAQTVISKRKLTD
jgi:ABC-2 type transport system permease protein